MKVMLSALFDQSVDWADVIDTLTLLVEEVEEGKRALPLSVEVRSSLSDHAVKVRVDLLEDSGPSTSAPLDELPF